MCSIYSMIENLGERKIVTGSSVEKERKLERRMEDWTELLLSSEIIINNFLLAC